MNISGIDNIVDKLLSQKGRNELNGVKFLGVSWGVSVGIGFDVLDLGVSVDVKRTLKEHDLITPEGIAERYK